MEADLVDLVLDAIDIPIDGAQFPSGGKFGKGLHLIARYECVDRDPADRRITCECDWHGLASEFSRHRIKSGASRAPIRKALIERN